MAQVYAIDGFVPVIDPTAFVHPTAVLIGDVLVGPGCYVAPLVSLRGDLGRVVLEAGANIQDGCVAHTFPGAETLVEENGHVGHGVVLRGCRIGRNALVGMGSVVMDGVVIGAECFVAAMSFVKAGSEVAPRSLLAGIPARLVRQVSDAEIAWKSEATAVYRELARRSLATLVPATPLTAPEPDRPRRAAGPLRPLHETRARER